MKSTVRLFVQRAVRTGREAATFCWLYATLFVAPPNFGRMASAISRVVENAPGDETFPFWVTSVCIAAALNRHQDVMQEIGKRPPSNKQ